MALSLTVRMGGGTASGTADYSDQWRIFGPNGERMFDAGNAFDNGGSTQWQFVIDDDNNEIPSVGTAQLAAHNLVTVIDDAPGFDAWVGRGRISNKQQYRGDVQMGDAIQWSVTVDDANTHLKGLALVTPWVRSSESGRARVLALIAAFLQGDPRLTTNLDDDLVASGGEVNMPAKTYPAGTELAEILDDCATVEGKVYGVVIHHVDSASHECLMYVDEADHTTYLSTLTITDDDPDLSTEFPPIWDQGPAALHDGQELTSHLISSYGAGTASFTVASDTTRVDAYDYWAVGYNDSASETSAQASTRAAQILEERSVEHVTHQATIKLPANKIHLVEAGMSIAMKAAASMGGVYLDTTQTRRIAQCKKEPIAPEVGEVVGQYLVHLQLDRPVRVFAAKKGAPVGPKPPSSGQAAAFISGFCAINNAGTPTQPTATIAEGESLLVFVGAYVPDIGDTDPSAGPGSIAWQDGDGENGESLTKVKDVLVHENADGSNDLRLQAWYLAAPTARSGKVAFASGSKYYYSIAIVSANNGTPTVTTNQGTDSSAEISVAGTTSGDLLVGFMFQETHDAGDPGSVSGDQTQVCEQGQDGTNSSEGSALEYVESSGGTVTFSRSLTSAKDWGYIVAKFAGEGADTTQPIGDTGDAGDDFDTYAPIDHVHAHGTFTSGDYHTEYQKESEKGQASGYASLGSDGLVPQDQLGTGTQDGTKFLRDDGTWQAPGGGASELDDLNDVTITTPADAQVLTYDSDTSTWVNANAASGFSNPMSAVGDLIVGGTAGAAGRLAAGTEGQHLAVASDGTLEWVTPSGGSGATGNAVLVLPHGHIFNPASAFAPAASAAKALPIIIPAPMQLEALMINISSAGSGAIQWGLFDYTSDPSACTKLAGGSAAPGGTDWREIAATSAPVSIDPGAYMLIVQQPASNGSTWRYSGFLTNFSQFQNSYTWSDTPDLTTGWTGGDGLWGVALKGKLTSTEGWF